MLVEAEEIYLSYIVRTACICLTLKRESASLELAEYYCLTDHAYNLAVIAVDIVECVSVEESEIIGIDDTGFVIKIVREMVSDIDHLIVLAEECDIHARIERLYGASELRDVIYFGIYSVEDDIIAIAVVVCKYSLHISIIFGICGSIYDNECRRECPATGDIDLLEEFGRGYGSVPFHKDDIGLVLLLDVEHQCLIYFIGFDREYCHIVPSEVLGSIFLFAFFCCKHYDLLIAEIIFRCPGTDERSLAAVKKSREKINQTVIHTHKYLSTE